MADKAEVKTVGDDGKVEVSVNEKSVVLDSAEQTGASVKKAAIEQGVKIAAGLVLIIELGDGKSKLVGDDEKIAVRPGEPFVAVEKDTEVEASVNDKPVVLKGVRQTGATVKRSAIAEGVRIAEDFVLSIELGGGKTKLVGDDEEIVVRAGERFLAIENDDNS